VVEHLKQVGSPYLFFAIVAAEFRSDSGGTGVRTGTSSTSVKCGVERGTSAVPVTSAVSHRSSTEVVPRFCLTHSATLKLKKIANFNKLNLLNSI